MPKKIIIITFLLISASLLHAQKNYYANPLKIPMYLSGSFAELRGNHFHSGIDIKTQGVEGKSVNAVADGYVSRITVSSVGFGNALYINHPNGTTSVYGHLKSFTKDIGNYVKSQQYSRESFSVNLYPPSSLFKVKKGEQIALSGNSGSSGGPHLHFEIRDAATQDPLNPLNYSFDVKDNVAPKFFSLLVAPLGNYSSVESKNDKKMYPIVLENGVYRVKGNPVIKVSGNIGFGINSYDYFNGTHNKCGLYEVKLLVDSVEQFKYKLERFAFHHTRYINSHIDYETYKKMRRKYQRLWREPGNLLPIYKHNSNYGIVNFNSPQIHMVEIVAKDTYGNQSTLKFQVKGNDTIADYTSDNLTKKFYYNTANFYYSDDVKFKMPKGALYNHLNFTYRANNKDTSYYSPIHQIYKNTTPIQKRSSLSLKATRLPDNLKPKALIIKIDEAGKVNSAGGSYKEGWVTTKVRDFGNYAVFADTKAPKIVPLSIKNKSAITESKRIRFKILDDLSGIKSIEGRLDGKWMLFEYDAKRNLITHYFDSSRFQLKKRHKFVLKVIDNKNNTATYKASFWK